MAFRPLHSGHLWSFAAVGIAAALVSLGQAVPAAAPSPDRDADAAAKIGAVTGLAVRPGSLVWREGGSSRGLGSAIGWQELVFLASDKPGAPADLYRIAVRVDPRSRIFAAKAWKNLSNSPVGDEYGIVARPPHVLVATRVLGQTRSLTLLDLDAAPPVQGAGRFSLASLLAHLTELQQSGRFEGIERRTLRFDPPPEGVALSVVPGKGGDAFAAAWSDRRGTGHRALIDLSSGRSDDPELPTTDEVLLPKSPVLWLVDTVRALWFVGSGPVEALERSVFAIRDASRRITYRIFGPVAAEDQDGAPDAGESERPLVLPPGREIGTALAEGPWPPPPVQSPAFRSPEPGEGVWKPCQPDFSRRLPDAPPAIYKTYVRPDRERPYVQVFLFAADMRQLELHMVAGHEDPQSTTGSVGTGMIPRRPEILTRLVALFNGAFKTLHGAYGMMVERDILLPPRDGAATIATFEDGRAAMGSWPDGGPIPEEMVSLRQNLDPLVDHGVVNPKRRYLWGFTLSDDITEMNTVRSGVCMTSGGALIYAWGEDLTAHTLGLAMNAAGCDYAMHLDMNPMHTSFIYYRFDENPDLRRPRFRSGSAHRGMAYNPDRFVNGAPKDFFFLTLGGLGPPGDWSSEGLAQPAPAFVPAVFSRQVGASRLLAVDMTRVRAEIDPGAVPEELLAAGAPRAPGEDSDLLACVDLGGWSSARGQIGRGAVLARLADAVGTLARGEDGAIRIGAWPLENGAGERIDDAVQGRWLDAGASEPVTALGMIDRRWLVIGQGPARELAAAFGDLKIEKAIAFDRPASGTALGVRREQGLVDAVREESAVPNPEDTALRLFARPRRLGAERLEPHFPGIGLERGEALK